MSVFRPLVVGILASLLSVFGTTTSVNAQYVANQTCTFALSDPATNYSTWTRDDCRSIVYELAEDPDGNPLFGLSTNRDSRMRNCCPLAQEFFRCFTTSNWSTYDPSDPVDTMTAISPTGCTGYFDEQVALKPLGNNLDCEIPPPPYCEPVNNCLEVNSPRNFTDASGLVISGPWPNTRMDTYGSILCASSTAGPLFGKYTGVLTAYCDNGTMLSTNDSCVANPCGVNGGELNAGYDASGIELWGPWQPVLAGDWSYIECHPCVSCRVHTRLCSHTVACLLCDCNQL